jgi:O-antigen ligase
VISNQQAHTLYGQLIAENGTLGVVAFLGILACFSLNAWEIRDHYRGIQSEKDEFLFLLSRSILFSVFLLLLLGLGGHNLYRYNWLWFGAFQAIALYCVRHSTEQSLATQSPVYWNPQFESGRSLG